MIKLHESRKEEGGKGGNGRGRRFRGGAEGRLSSRHTVQTPPSGSRVPPGLQTSADASRAGASLETRRPGSSAGWRPPYEVACVSRVWSERLRDGWRARSTAGGPRFWGLRRREGGIGFGPRRCLRGRFRVMRRRVRNAVAGIESAETAHVKCAGEQSGPTWRKKGRGGGGEFSVLR